MYRQAIKTISFPSAYHSYKFQTVTFISFYLPYKQNVSVFFRQTGKYIWGWNIHRNNNLQYPWWKIPRIKYLVRLGQVVHLHQLALFNHLQPFSRCCNLGVFLRQPPLQSLHHTIPPHHDPHEASKWDNTTMAPGVHACCINATKTFISCIRQGRYVKYPAFVCLCVINFTKKLLNGSSRKFYHRHICAQGRTD